MPDPLDPAMREAIVAQVRAGRSPEEVLQPLLDAGWEEQQAVDAIDAVMRGFLEQHAAAEGLPPPVPVPVPAEWNGAPCIDAGDREVRVLAHLLHPQVIVFGGLLDDAECEALVALARPRLSRSLTVDMDTGGDVLHEARTSEGMSFVRGETPLLDRIERRIARLIGWPLENGEGLQVLRYGIGAEYKPHHDYFDPDKPGAARILARGGQRVASLVIYLDSPASGGATVFPELNLAVSALRGNAVFFSYDRPHPMTRSLHGGAPVVAGEKWIATKWLRERAHA